MPLIPDSFSRIMVRMIPHRLRLHNFMCYREEQSLDFSGIHLACLAGDNGHGKSALLDAMTWALWGKARARRDDELITLGETDMWVELEFDLGRQRFRVWRQRTKRGQGQSDLHFSVWNASGGEWQLLDEGTLRERQAQITRTLRMEYETFTNSAFLLQGRADSFTLKTPGERKQILADILGLNRYDAYEEQAKLEAQARKDGATRTQGEIDAIDRELTHREEYEQRLQAAQMAAAQAAEDLRGAEADRSRWLLAVQEREAQERQLSDLQDRLIRAERDLLESQQQLADARIRLANVEAVVAQREEIEAGWAALQSARRDEAAWNVRLFQSSQLQERLSRAQWAVDQSRLVLEADRLRLEDQRQELHRKAAAGLEQEPVLAELTTLLAGLAAHEARRQEIAAELRDLVEQVGLLRAEGERLKADGLAAREKTVLLAGAEAAACPLCGQPLTPDHRDRMLADFRAERDHLALRFQANQADLKALNLRKTALEAEDGERARALRPRDARQRQLAQAEAAISEGRAAAEQELRVADQIHEIDDRLDSGAYAGAERAELALVQAALAELGYDAAAHETVRKRAENLESFDARYQRQLLPALESLSDLRAQVDSLTALVSRQRNELVEDRAARDRLAEAVADLPERRAARDRAAATVDAAAGAERRAHQEEGAAMQMLDALAAQAERRIRFLTDLDGLNREISVYNQLREAFGKKGLQAMIIESAIPEVEVEANRLLSRMSDGRMSLRLETQREKVTGGMAETLDIVISDELGSRAYELYSGGEAFRVNLALRIAISKLLAGRAGAQLQTLVIDEGFGTQDALGRQLLVEAINSIQGDFERILVITHIEELRDMFPARIEVLKTASGSRVRVA
jgi:exonuclease SbcC